MKQHINVKEKKQIYFLLQLYAPNMYSLVTPIHTVFNWLHRFLIVQSRLFFSHLAPVHYEKLFLNSICCQKNYVQIMPDS